MQSPAGCKVYKAATNPLLSSDKFHEEIHGLYGVLEEYLYRGGENVCIDAVSGINMIYNEF